MLPEFGAMGFPIFGRNCISAVISAGESYLLWFRLHVWETPFGLECTTYERCQGGAGGLGKLCG